MDPTHEMVAILVGLPALALLAGLVLYGGEAQSDAQPPKIEARIAEDRPRSASQWIAVDGDTIKSPAGVNYRLVGFDAPETFQAKSQRELDKGRLAKRRLQELMDSGEVTLEPVNDRGKDKYGRELARAYIGGEDVADIMINEGHASAYDGKSKRKPW